MKKQKRKGNMRKKKKHGKIKEFRVKGQNICRYIKERKNKVKKKCKEQIHIRVLRHGVKITDRAANDCVADAGAAYDGAAYTETTYDGAAHPTALVFTSPFQPSG